MSQEHMHWPLQDSDFELQMPPLAACPLGGESRQYVQAATAVHAGYGAVSQQAHHHQLHHLLSRPVRGGFEGIWLAEWPRVWRRMTIRYVNPHQSDSQLRLTLLTEAPGVPLTGIGLVMAYADPVSPVVCFVRHARKARGCVVYVNLASNTAGTMPTMILPMHRSSSRGQGG
ncbi:hypothetical protein S40293_10363 [Stachybotrys chartarum IBT 40293]|nr:hypothetical protein S40293_10363 [Stachybotrys chartarum IBT 40293]